jgi:hypothetical protein
MPLVSDTHRISKSLGVFVVETVLRFLGAEDPGYRNSRLISATPALNKRRPSDE